MRLRCADAIIRIIAEQGIDVLFGYPGASALSLYDALYKQKTVKHLLSSHEQWAIHAADGYSRATDKVGTVFSTSGPGATNLVTGLANAFMDSIPLVAITCNVPLFRIGTDSFQEVDIFNISMPITKHNFMVKHASEVCEKLRSAYTIAKSGRRGPVLIDIPAELLEERISFEPKPPAEQRASDADYSQLEAAAELINNAEHPVILAGGGTLCAGQAVRELSERISAPIASTLMSRGLFSYSEKCYLGMLGIYGSIAANRAFDESDLIIGIGTRFTERTLGGLRCNAAEKKLVHIDIDPAEINKNLASTVSITGDCSETLPQLTQLLSKSERELQVSPMRFVTHPMHVESGLDPALLFDGIAHYAGTNHIYTTEVGQHQMWAANKLHTEPGGGFITSGGLGTMGFGLPAAIGASAGTGRDVTVISGDGSLNMNIGELSTVAAYGLPIRIFVMNNSSLGMIGRLQQNIYGKKNAGSSFKRRTDFCAAARSFGLRAYRIERNGDIEPVLCSAYAHREPCLVDCRIDSLTDLV